jgi:hypothetical protein
MVRPTQPIYLSNSPYCASQLAVSGEYCDLLGDTYYRIANYDQMPPFFMTVVSDSDHWLFISSTGGLSAGRVNADSALFPYETEDKLRDRSEHTGSKTLLLVTKDETTSLWEPFSCRTAGLYRVRRNLYKNHIGNSLLFEEVNDDLQLAFRYAWRASDQFGFVRTAWLENTADSACTADILDGLQNILPYGVTALTQREFSVLLDAYKRSELDVASGLGIFSLSSTLTDLAEPSESLKATPVWQAGLTPATYLLSSRQLEAFRQGGALEAETDLRGARSAFLVNACMTLDAHEARQWHIVADVDRDSSHVVALVKRLTTDRPGLCDQLEADIQRGHDRLTAIVASADGLQASADHLSTAHHLSNVLFNVMRGGIFSENYTIRKDDFVDFVRVRNQPVLLAQAEFFSQLPAEFRIDDLVHQAAQAPSADLERLCYEYVPLTFSRRHGDPSRPWNTFSINLKNEDGSQKLDYQGNWRDIFQNWEPLAYSYPEFVESLISKFLNATTADGYNPYRLTRNGIEWEVPEPENPWANIGYWSDHQIIYLQKFLELSTEVHPGELHDHLQRPIFSHANVPYRIKPYSAVLDDCYNTIEFDGEHNRRIADLVNKMGTDGKLVLGADEQVLHVNLAEKLLILLLAKLSNFVPEGGIWMNTQRPEWNDANNALAGKGLSVVTTCYLRRFAAFCRELFHTAAAAHIQVTTEVRAWFQAVNAILERFQPVLSGSFSEAQRRSMLDAVGQAGSDYRTRYYDNGFCGQFAAVSSDAIVQFLEMVVEYLEHTIRANKREDGLYHAYNVLQFQNNSVSIRYLYEMLEGQVAVLSSGMLSAQEALDVLRALRQSRMYRADQHSYMLYPDRDLPGFLGKNRVPAARLQNSALVTALRADNNTTLLAQDANGDYHFNGSFRNARDVQAALDELAQQEAYAELVAQERDAILALFEEVFDHASFTGRSGTFFGYEGLGSIYWHMVSKLLLAVQENVFHAIRRQAGDTLVTQLAEAYYDIRSGLGFNKSPEGYGAFPTDPYSHTPLGKGAQQPGMTGQVKEDILTRFGELGLGLEHGEIVFRPVLLRAREWLAQPQRFEYRDVAGQPQTLELPPGTFAYTFCQVPIVYRAAPSDTITIILTNGTICEVEGNRLDAEYSGRLFRRDGYIKQLAVGISDSKKLEAPSI